MASTRAVVAYKKKDGHLTVAADRNFLFWTPATPPGAPPTVTVPVADITNLQQTPESSAKVALKVFVKAESHVFSFTSKTNARKEQEAVTDTLRDTIAANKAATAAQLAPAATTATQNGGDAGGQSAAMAIASASSSKAPADEGWYTDATLKSSFPLQRSLLESSKPLNDRFTQALRDKPDTVSIPQFTAQFWSTRLHLLRAHAIEKAQREGEYNVLPSIKHTSVLGEDGEYKKVLNVTKEQIALIFKQYPVVRRAYNETTPKPIEKPSEFWGRFFASRLLKKLKGERIDRNDAPDSILDRYLDYADGIATAGGEGVKIPHFIDLEGNEQNTKFTVNREGYEMSAAKHDQPILHVLNNLSEKMLSHVAAADGQAHAPIGLDEDAFEQLQLRDLAREDVDNRVVLNIREQRHAGGQEGDDLSAEARVYAMQDPGKVLGALRRDLRAARLGSDERGSLRLDRVIGFHSDDDSDGEDEAQTANGNGAAKATARIGSHAAMTLATTSALASIRASRSAQHGSSAPSSADDASDTSAAQLNGLSQSTSETLQTVHATTTEFLHYFWTLFLSGSASPAKILELQSLVATLDKSLDRIEAVAVLADEERVGKIRGLRGQVAEYAKRTGKRRKVDESAVGGGRGAVEALLAPTVEALGKAVGVYREAFVAQGGAGG
ncbi:hypothetical protein LTR08_004156 [Meristemomyces frigidus]|nr:hypothetical protein LTR08_004156 [Meristemomyces frigidus]